MTVTSPGRQRLRILIVDDYADIAESTAMVLRLEGDETIIAFDGATALAIAEEKRPDVVLCDIGMPKMAGYEVARCLRRMLGNKILLVAISAYGYEEARARSLAAGFDCHFVKPVDPLVLQRLLRDFARASATQDDE